MAGPQYQQLAISLEKAKKHSKDGFLKSSEIDRQTRERLMAAGYLTIIIRGWYLFSRPDAAGSSTAWYGSFWDFLKRYLSDRFEKYGYCLSPETSIDIHTGETTISNQVIVQTKVASNQNVKLPHDTSLFLYFDKQFPDQIERKNGLNLIPMAQAITRLSPSYFLTKQGNVEIALKTVSTTDLSRALLQLSSQAAASRIIGALSAIGEGKKASQIHEDLKAAGILINAKNPFQNEPILGNIRVTSPYAGRIEAIWRMLKPQVVSRFPQSENGPKSMAIIEQYYEQDAYHSLSIEGYEVTEELIKKIASGNWRPEDDMEDKEQKDAMAAKGYFEAFKSVMKSVKKIWDGAQSGEVFEDELQNWYRALFSASTQSGLVDIADLAGFRNGPVFIKGSRHVPLPKDAVPDAMNKLFELIKTENDARVRAVLGHFLIGYIHPYLDGNGRIARFLMNVMLVTGGYNWTVIRVEKRSEYMAALEKCSISDDIAPFVDVIVSEMEFWKKNAPTVSS